MSASCCLTHGCGGATHGFKKASTFRAAVSRPPSPCLPEGFDYVRGGRGSGVWIGLPGKGDGGAGDFGHLGFGGGAGDEVWISGPVWLNRDSKLFMKMKRRTLINETHTRSVSLLVGAYRELLRRLSTTPPRWVWRRCTRTCQCPQAGGGDTKTVDSINLGGNMIRS